MAPLVSIPAVALPIVLVWLLATSVTSFLPQPQPPWAPTKQPVQLNTGIGATIGGALYAGLGPRSAALAEPAATSAPVATEPSRIFFIEAPRPRWLRCRELGLRALADATAKWAFS